MPRSKRSRSSPSPERKKPNDEEYHRIVSIRKERSPPREVTKKVSEEEPRVKKEVSQSDSEV
jgi:hypothetical protein